MKNEDLINAVAVIAEPVRIQILRLIASKGEMCAKDILPKFDITQPTLSHHMSILEEHGLVSSRKQGRCVFYSINKKTFTAINAFFRDFVEPGNIEVDVSIKRKKPQTKAAAPVKAADKKKKDKEKSKEKDKKKK